MPKLAVICIAMRLVPALGLEVLKLIQDSVILQRKLYAGCIP